MASAIDLRVWSRLPYLDPTPLLVQLGAIASSDLLRAAPPEVAALQTRELRPLAERRHGALFFYLMGQAQRTPVYFSHLEGADHDFVGLYERDGIQHYVPVQMKELPPVERNPTIQLQDIIDAARDRYADATDLTVAVAMNRVGEIRLSKLNLSGMAIKGLWLFGTSHPDQSRWMLIGNLMQGNAQAQEFHYPTGI